ncbi:MAG: hypothetical protein Q9211_002601 [Gyalolechia sp. 1 TL-2023]
MGRLSLEDKERQLDPDYVPPRWRSTDLDPVAKPQKKWEWYHVGGFWIAEGFSAAQIQTSSAAVAVGLNPGLALVAYSIGNLIIAIPCCAIGYIGSKYSVNFPVIARGLVYPPPPSDSSLIGVASSFGLWGSYLPIVIRMAVAPICADITASALLSLAIFWTVSLPFLYLSPPKLRWLFVAKVATMPLLWVALFTWALTAAGGFGPLLGSPSKPTNGMSTGYLFCYAITAAIGGASTFAVNIPDITRYAHDPRSSTLAQAVALPLCLTLTYLLGITLAATTQVVYGQVYWNPLEMVEVWDNRPAKFFTGLLFAFANIGTSTNHEIYEIVFAHDKQTWLVTQSRFLTI